MNTALQISARYDPQINKTSLGNSSWFLLELDFKRSQHLLKKTMFNFVLRKREKTLFTTLKRQLKRQFWKR